ncbi:MAG: GGDEF domain-containing protein [Bdellovibrionaceae bacterium]|jgi:diguanylate cyclase (GGDEF)-like protein|nr:GGDEF domain-containing protein [Pseudobdellovibrionaceae bacterium]
MSCPRFLKTLDLNDFLENLFDFFAFKVDVANIIWLSYEYSQKNIEKNNNRTSEFFASVTYGSTKDYKFSDRSMGQSYHFIAEDFTSIKKNNDGTYDIFFLVKYKNKKLGYIVFKHIFMEETFVFSEQVTQLLSSASEQLHYCLEFAKLQEKAFRDDLTHFYNQRFLSNKLNEIIKQHHVNKKEMSVLFIDMDHFKFINDNFGHIVGSELLKQIANLFENHLGINDLGIRYGGDEFILLLLDKSEQESLEIAEAIRSSLEQTTFLIDSRKINITASIGLASYPKHAKNSQQVLKMADEAMYNAKSKSRNRVYVAS